MYQYTHQNIFESVKYLLSGKGFSNFALTQAYTGYISPPILPTPEAKFLIMLDSHGEQDEQTIKSKTSTTTRRKPPGEVLKRPSHCLLSVNKFNLFIALIIFFLFASAAHTPCKPANQAAARVAS